MFKKLLYGIRWQLSGIILIPFVVYLGPIYGVILGNFVGACVFFYLDRYLTSSVSLKI